MRRSRNLLKRIGGVIAISALALSTIAAGVNVNAGLAGSSTTIESNEEGTTQTRASASFTGVVNGGGVTFAFECDGQGIGAAASTSMNECFLQTGDTTVHALDRINLPGNVVAAAQTTTISFQDLGDKVRVCAVVSVTPIVGTPGDPTESCVDDGVGVSDIELHELKD